MTTANSKSIQGDGLDDIREGSLVLKKGNSADAVSTVRARLESVIREEPRLKTLVLGHLGPKDTIVSLKSPEDGSDERHIFNEDLRRVVKQFQKLFALNVCGNIGRQTLAVLDRLYVPEVISESPAERLLKILNTYGDDFAERGLDEYKRFAAEHHNSLQIVLDLELPPKFSGFLSLLTRWSTAIELAKELRRGDSIEALNQILHRSPDPVASVILLQSSLPPLDKSGLHPNPTIARLELLLEYYQKTAPTEPGTRSQHNERA